MGFFGAFFSGMLVFGTPDLELSTKTPYEQCLEDCLEFAEKPDHRLKACIRKCDDLLPPEALDDIESWNSGDF